MVWAWGRNKSGYMGNDTCDDSSVPVKVENLNKIIKISANGSRCLALRSDGTVWFWGLVYLDYYENIKIYQNAPVLIESLNNVQLIKAGGGNKSIVMKTDNTYWVFDSYNRIQEKVQFN